MSETPSKNLPYLTLAARAVALLGLEGFSLGLALAAALWAPPLQEFFLDNQIPVEGRAFLLNLMLRAGGLGAVAGALFLIWKRKDETAADRLYATSCRLSPLSCLGFLPILFRWQTWTSRPLVFLFLALFFSLAVWGTLTLALRSPPLFFESRLRDVVLRVRARLRERFPRTIAYLPFAVVVAAALGYALYFSYYTVCYHYCVRSGYDLGIKNNLFWNTLHGAHFKASVTLGPQGHSHFGRHADVLLYFLLPVYYFWQRPETLLVLQSLFLGAAAIPLYCIARRRLGSGASALIALSYLLHPAVHGTNLFEFHFLPLGLLLLWAAWALLERGRLVWGSLFVALTLFTREDVSLWVVFLGLYLIFSGERPKAGTVAALVGSLYFLLIKLWIMPLFADKSETFLEIYSGLLPPEDSGFSGVLKTLVGNPAFVLSTLLKEDKLIYLLQIFLPVALLPLRWKLWPLLMVPGFLLTILSPDYQPVFDIYYQYAPHWLAFLYPLVALGIPSAKREEQTRLQLQTPALTALVVSSVVLSFQYGAVLQQNTARGGPYRYVFGIDDTGRQRHQAIAAIQGVLPPAAKVACSAWTAPQFSSRTDDYDMNQGVFDAEYIVFPIDPRAFIANEKRSVRYRLESGTFGVVLIHPPFALAQRGHPTDRNAELLQRIPE